MIFLSWLFFFSIKLCFAFVYPYLFRLVLNMLELPFLFIFRREKWFQWFCVVTCTFHSETIDGVDNSIYTQFLSMCSIDALCVWILLNFHFFPRIVLLCAIWLNKIYSFQRKRVIISSVELIFTFHKCWNNNNRHYLKVIALFCCKTFIELSVFNWMSKRNVRHKLRFIQ